MDKFKEFPLVDALAGGDMLKYEAVLQMDYHTAFIKMWYDKEKADYQEAYQKVISKKK